MRGTAFGVRRVRNLPVDPGPAAWNCLLPKRKAGAALFRDTSADWLVIGAGFAGLAAARRILQHQPKARVVVLEAREVAEGPAGRNSGFMIDLPHDLASAGYGGALDADRAQTRANRAAIAFARDMAADYDLGGEAFSQTGKINAAATDKGHRHNLDYAAHLSAMGEAHEVYDAARMHALTGTGYYQSGLFTPGAAMIQPALFVCGVAEGLAKSGVSIFENSPVVALDRPGDWQARTPMGCVTAPRVVLAVNGHANSFGFFKRRLMHVFTYASMTRALTEVEVARLGGAPVWGATPADPMGTTVRRVSGIGGDRLIIRNRFTFDPSMVVSDRRIARVGQDHDQAFAARFPMLKGVAMQYRWGGRLCLSRNNVAAFGEVAPGLFSACCQNGLGTAKGTLAGMMTVDLALGMRSDILTDLQAQAAPSKLPPNPIAWLGANATLRWGERQARREL